MENLDQEDLKIIFSHDQSASNKDLYCVILANEYYHRQNYEKMEKFCKLSIKNETGSAVAMHIMGRYYKNIKKDYPKMKISYDISISKGYILAMCDMGYYYWTIEHDHEKVKKYYGLAIEKNDIFAMAQLGQYYYEERKNLAKAKKYTLMAVQHEDKNSVINLLVYHINSGHDMDCEVTTAILPYVEELVNDERIKLYIIENCINNKIKTKIFGTEIIQNNSECSICMENKDLFVKPSCNHYSCSECFIRCIRETNTLCSFCRKEYIDGVE